MNDFAILFEKVSHKGISSIASKLFLGEQSRVKKVWDNTDDELTHWWDIPEVMQRWNEKITGNKNTVIYEYVREKYFNEHLPLQGLSIGCGAGNKEIKWVQAIQSLTLKGIDISPKRISAAINKTQQLNLQDRLSFSIENVYTMALRPAAYDLIILDNALHHFSNVPGILDSIGRVLKPEGLLIVNEYVGPSRFQWTEKQLAIVNSLLSELPESYRKKVSRNSIKKKEYRRGTLSMYINDPSEAIESDKIENELSRRFDTIEKKEYGGTILPLVFRDIARNFIKNDEQTKNLLKYIFNVEDTYLSSGELKSDYMFFVARSKNHIN